MLDNKNSRLKDEQIKVLLSVNYGRERNPKKNESVLLQDIYRLGIQIIELKRWSRTRELPSNLQEEIDMSRLLLEDEPLVVLPKLATVIGLNEAIILQQLHYWLEKVTT